MSNTAIAVVYARGGFAVAADGRMRLKKEVVSEIRQKVFKIQEPTRALTYALSGDVVLPEIFDFAEAAKQAVQSLSNRNPADLVRYAELVAAHINKALRAKSIPTYKDEEGTGTIAYLQIAGYYDEGPSYAKVRFYHRNLKLAHPVIEESNILRQVDYWLQGSPVIGEHLFGEGDSPLAVFRSPGFAKLKRREDLTLDEAVTVSRNFIEAHVSEDGNKLDPSKCESVGGHVHVAKVTRDAGFKWVIPPMQGLEG